MFFSSLFNKILFVGLVFSCTFVSAPPRQGTAEDLASFKRYFTFLLSGDIDVEAPYDSEAAVEEAFSPLEDSWGCAANYRDKMRAFLDSSEPQITFKSKTLRLYCYFDRAEITDLYSFLRPLVFERRNFLNEIIFAFRAKRRCLDITVEA